MIGTFVRRPHLLFAYPERRSVVDIEALLQGSVELKEEEQIRVFPLPGEEGQPVSPRELELLFRIPAVGWTPVATLVEGGEVTEGEIEALVERGLLFSKPSEDGREAAQQQLRNERLKALHWNPMAAFYHYASQWRDVDLGFRSGYPQAVEEELQEVCPPGFFQAPGTEGEIPLPLTNPDDPFFDLLDQRKTTRSWEEDTPLPFDQLSTVLRYTFGCRSLRPGDPIQSMRKTSPSGGALHPTEAFPLLLNVEGVDPGLYHYDVGNHCLRSIRKMSTAEGRELALLFTGSQHWFAAAHALFLTVTRFARNFWKYPHHTKTYKTLMMDAAHISQTNFLVCAQLKLGAFITAAINDVNILEELGLDPVEFGALCILGCGIPAEEPPQLRLATEPYSPRRSSNNQ